MKKQIIVFFFIAVAAVSFIACDASKFSANQTGQTENSAEISDLTSLIMSSYSARMFKEAAVPAEILEVILNCGHKAPSAQNLQPWHFTVITNSEIARQLVPRDYKEGAAVIVISGRAEERIRAILPFDLGLAAQNMYLAAQALGLGSRMYYSGVQNINDNLKPALGIPDGYNAQMIMLFGYVADDVDAVTAASARRPLEGFINYVE